MTETNLRGQFDNKERLLMNKLSAKICVRPRLIQKGVQYLMSHEPFCTWQPTAGYQRLGFTPFESHRMQFLGDYLSGRGKKKNRLAWWILADTHEPTPREITLITKVFAQLRSHC